MAKTEGTYIQVAYKNVFGYISTNSWPFFMIQRPTIREKCAWVRFNTWRDERPDFFGFSIFRQTSQLATEKIQNLCNRNRWSGLLQLGLVRFRSFFHSSELDLQTLTLQNGAMLIHSMSSIFILKSGFLFYPISGQQTMKSCSIYDMHLQEMLLNESLVS